MKKLLALTLALLMALSCMTAFASTVYTKATIDEEVAKSLLTGFGVPEDQMAMVDPVLKLINALGVKVITAADGAQIDLDLNGSDALSLGFATDEAGVTVASTLFPNYVVTVSNETIGQLLEQVAANMPAAGGEGGSFDMTAMTELFGKYFQPWVEACTSAGQPGDPVTGEYEFEGYKFDTQVPVTVDMNVINEATQKLMDDLLADPAAMAALKGFAQGASQGSGKTFDETQFEEEFKAGFEEWMAHMPATVTAEVYTNSDGSQPFYMTAEAQREGEDGLFTCNMLFVDQTNMTMGFQDGDKMSAGFNMNGDSMGMYFDMGGMYFGLAFTFAENQINADIYFLNDEKPLISVAVESTEGGERTLSLDAEGKTALAVEDLMNDQTGEASQGLLGDVMMNGLGTLMGVLSEQVPEIAGLMAG